MDTKTKKVRRMLENMAPVDCVPFIQSFLLPADEERYIIDHEANKKAIVEIALENHVSVDTVHKKRSIGLCKMANSIQYKQ